MFYSLEEYEKLRRKLTREEFDSTVDGKFTSPAKGFFTRQEIDGSLDLDLNEIKMVGEQPFFFLDVGVKHDQCVLVGGFVKKHKDYDLDEFVEIHVPIIHIYPKGYPLTRVAGADIDADDGWHYEKSVKEYVDGWKAKNVNPVFGFDVTGNGGMKALFESIKFYAIDVNFAGPTKSEMYQRFKYFMEKGLLHRPKHKEFEYQAGHLEVKKSARGFLMISHSSEEDLDDVMDATAGLINLCDPFGYVEPTVKMF